MMKAQENTFVRAYSDISVECSTAKTSKRRKCFNSTDTIPEVHSIGKCGICEPGKFILRLFFAFVAILREITSHFFACTNI